MFTKMQRNAERNSVGDPVYQFAIRAENRTDADLLTFDTREERDRVFETLVSDAANWDEHAWRAYYSEQNDGHWTIGWHAEEPAPETPETPETEVSPREAEVAELRRQLDQVRDDLTRVTAERDLAREPIADPTDARLTPIWDLVGKKADDEGFCSEYDQLANALGIPGRERRYRGTVTVCFNAYAYTYARGEDAAENAMDDAIRAAVYDLSNDEKFSSIEFESIDIEDVDIL